MTIPPLATSDSSLPSSLVDAVECRARRGLPEFFAKLEAGSEVRIAYLGGSITQAEGWRPLSFQWFREQYPNAELIEIDAAIAGTGSNFGVLRLDRQVLQRHPDMLFIEFATNDAHQPAEVILRSMEGIVRKALDQNPRMDICFVYTVRESNLSVLQSGKFQRSASAMEKLADHYSIPTIHLGLEVARLAQNEKLLFTGKVPATPEEIAELNGRILFSPDGVHPYPETGHPLYLDAIVRSVPSLKDTERSPRIPPAPLTEYSRETEYVPIEDLATTVGWTKVTSAAPLEEASKREDTLWQAASPGEGFTFRFHGRHFAICGMKGPDSGSFSVTIDNDPPHHTTFFDAYCEEHRYRFKPWICPELLSEGEHKVRVELTDQPIDKAGILSQRGLTIHEPAEFEGNRLYISGVYVLGKRLADSNYRLV